jgi:hypothetical protein
MHHRWILVPLLAACASQSNPPPTQQTAHVDPPTPVPSVAAPLPTTTPTVVSAPAPAPKPVKHADKLALKRLAIARGVENKEPVDEGTSFNAKESRVYAFLEVENPEKLPGEVTVEFQPPKGKANGEIKLAVGEGSKWRTWAFTRQAHEEGEWTAIVRDAKGRELGRQTFNVTL